LTDIDGHKDRKGAIESKQLAINWVNVCESVLYARWQDNLSLLSDKTDNEENCYKLECVRATQSEHLITHKKG